MDPRKKAPPGESGVGKPLRASERDRSAEDNNPAAGNNPHGLDTRWGGTPDEWLHFDFILGLTADLLPVVGNPKAEKSELSKIAGPGKTPSRYNASGKIVGFPDWTTHRSTDAEVDAWQKQPDYGICLQTRTVRAIDVDVDDPDEAAAIRAALVDSLGKRLPIRTRSNSAKFLALVDLPGDYTKRRFKTAKGVIEFLATGQQAVVAGTHTSGVRYEWAGGLPASIPKLTPADFERLWTGLTERFGVEPAVETKAGKAPTSARKAADIDDPMVAYLHERWTVYGVAKSGRVDIRCPFHDEHTTESGESATSYFPAGVGGFAVGNFKCQHSHCAHRTNLDFESAIGLVMDEFEVIEDKPGEGERAPPAGVAAQALPAALNAARRKDGKISPTRGAVWAALSRPDICGARLAYDEFTETLMIGQANTGAWRPFTDTDYYALAVNLESGRNGFVHIPSDVLRGAVETTARSNTFDSARDWLTGLEWDGKPRVDRFLATYAGAPDSAYTRAVSRYWWTALAGRVLSPGIKADMAPIAVGTQGLRKTTLIHALVPKPDFVGELDLSKSPDAIAREMRGKLVMEIGELQGFKSKAVEHIKAFVSRQRDEWVPKYKEYSTTSFRRCMFFGTTNDDEIFADETGNRRWLPFRSTGADPAAVVAVREQLWAEGRRMFERDGIAWQEAERLGNAEHAEFTVCDPWDTAVHAWLFADNDFADEKGRRGRPADRGVTTSEVLVDVLALPRREQNQAAKTRVAKILVRLGFKCHNTKDGGGRSIRVYRRKGSES